jgi:4-amino-4-deoxy-L-arabinose transferase-like glycosyltransferase
MKETSQSKEMGEPDRQQVTVFVQPGTKVQISVEVGETNTDGKVPLTVLIDPLEEEGVQSIDTPQPAPGQVYGPRSTTGKGRPAYEAVINRLETRNLATWLFIFAIAIYLVTRLVGLTHFPIYFFTDEAIQSQSMLDLIKNGYRDSIGGWFPAYFRNGEYYNLSLSVYLQWLPALLFGKSAVVTRATSVFVTLIAAVSTGIILREVFKLKYWWAGILFLSITPAWFLHSRTAFETAEFVAFYAGMLCTYLLYRYKSPRYLYLAIFLGALSFYTYSPGQFIVPLTALGLLISDWRYHWENRRTVLIGLGLILILALPYIRYNINNRNVPFAHLHTLYSYWFENIPVSEKLKRYFTEFGFGLSPWYWYVPNDRDLSRHLMKGYGNIMIVTLPFALIGLAYILRNLRESACRAILITLLVSPVAGALVQISITRVLIFVIPVAILSTIGLEQFLLWIEDPAKRIVEGGQGPGFTSRRIAAALLILLIGIPLAFISQKTVNQVALSALLILLALQVSGVFEALARSFQQRDISRRLKFWKVPQAILAFLAFIILSGANVYMLNDALSNGPRWYRDYGLGGMQYGAFQIFDIVKQYVEEHPDARIILSPDWANGADVVARFFLGDSSSIQIGSVRGHITQKLPLDDEILFIMTPQEYATVKSSDKLTGIRVEEIIPYPDGKPGFYFIHLRYVDNIDEIFAAERATRSALRETVVKIDGQDVKVRYSYLDSDFQAESMALVFDNDPYTVAKTLESNPFVIEMSFPAARTLNGFSIIIGSAKVQITLKCYPTPGGQAVIYTFEGQGTRNQPELSFDLPKPAQIQVLQVEVLDPLSPEQAKVHIWELHLR